MTYDQFGRARFPHIAVRLSETTPVLEVLDAVGSAMIKAGVSVTQRFDFAEDLMSGTFTKLEAVSRWVTVVNDNTTLLEKPLPIDQQCALAIASVVKLRDNPFLSDQQRSDIAAIADSLTLKCNPILVEAAS